MCSTRMETITDLKFCFTLQLNVRKTPSTKSKLSVISGPSSGTGSDGISSVVCPGVTFTFTDNANCTSETSSAVGQFPQFLFSVLL